MSNTIQDTKHFYEDLKNFNPSVIFTLSLFGLIFTLAFIYYYKDPLVESYGQKVYLWFIFLIVLNLLNLLYISGYYKSKSGSIVGLEGPEGKTGKSGKRGDDLSCGYCDTQNEIGIQYSNDYDLVSHLQKTTNLLGELSIWRAKGVLGTAPLGDTIFPSKNASKDRTYIAGYGSKKADDFKKITTINDGVNEITIWKGVAPDGFTFLGDFAMVGPNPPDKDLVASLPISCLIENLKTKYNYIASFPAIDIIPLHSNSKITFCSFWTTTLNHLKVKVSDENYYTQSLYYNIVDGHPKWYDNKTNKPITEKLEELKKILQSMISVIYHHPNSTSLVKFNAPFVQNIRNSQGKIVSYKIYARAFEDFLNSNKDQSFETYLELYRKSLEYVYNIIKTSNNNVEFIHQTGSSVNSPLRSLELKLKEIKNDQHAYNEIDKFIKTIQNNNVSTLNILVQSNVVKTPSSGEKNISKMSSRDKQQLFVDSLVDLDVSDISKILKQFRKKGIYPTESAINFFGDDPVMNTVRNYRSMKMKTNNKNKKDDKIQFQLLDMPDSQIETEDQEIDPNLTLWDDLNYLFVSGLDHQIAKTKEDTLNGGYYLDAPENRQRRHFVNYLRTFIEPTEPIYAFRRKCMMFVDIDEERNQIIQDLRKAYDYLENQLSNLNAFQNCDNDKVLIKIYNEMMARIDQQFRSIDDYRTKIKNQDFSYFPTGRLKWLLGELNKYHLAIKNNCKSDERTRIITKIRLFRDRLENNFDYKLDLGPEINQKVSKMDFDNSSLSDLKKILKKYQDSLIQKSKINKDHSE
uniref:Uncharacterized protein n=1 Tax=viral metagenome TaxID=1070528 RepID=A0A6C0E7H0_9ZZZZ